MESNERMEADIERKVFAGAESTNNSVAVDNSAIAPVIIEELDESAVNEVDLNEFIEAKALKLQSISEKGNKETIVQSSSVNEDVTDANADVNEEQETEASREDQLTQQFLNGELTFTEYSLKMDSSR